MSRPSCDQFSFSRIEKELQIRECDVSRDDAISTIVDHLDAICDQILAGDAKGAPTLAIPEECFDYVLTEIREELETMMTDGFRDNGRAYNGRELAMSLLLHARTFWLQCHSPTDRVKATYRWSVAVIWGIFGLEVDLEKSSRVKATKEGEEEQMNEVGEETQKAEEIENEREKTGKEKAQGNEEQEADQDVLDLRTESWAEQMEQEEQGGKDKKEQPEAKRRCFRCMTVPEDGHTFRSCPTKQRVYGRRGRRSTRRGGKL